MKYFCIAFFIFFHLALSAQEPPILLPARVIFYNTENLFDTINNPETRDDDFLPAAKMQWNTEKYQLKLQHTAQVLSSMLDSIQPLIIGLAEVENESVLKDLIARPELKKFDWGIVHHDSPDERGIDVAMLYNKEILQETFSTFLTVPLPGDKTRDILYLKGYLNEGEPLWVFVNHWPSRRTGPAASQAKRLIAEQTLKNKIDNLFLGEKDARVIVMGDLNDNATDSSVQLLSSPAALPGQRLVNLMLPLRQANKFTTIYKGQKDIFDQLIVSENMLDKNASYHVKKEAAFIYSPQWLLYSHPKYGPMPNRTYAGEKWTAGYSDHLPVYFDVVFQ